jgi:hypothetical protein
VTHNLSPCQATIARFTSREVSAARAAWFKRASVHKTVSKICDSGEIDIGYSSGAENFCLNKFEVHRPFKPCKKSEP